MTRLPSGGKFKRGRAIGRVVPTASTVMGRLLRIDGPYQQGALMSELLWVCLRPRWCGGGAPWGGGDAHDKRGERGRKNAEFLQGLPLLPRPGIKASGVDCTPLPSPLLPG